MMGKIRRALQMPGSTPKTKTTILSRGGLPVSGNIIGIKVNIGNTMHSHISSSNDFIGSLKES